MTSNSENIISPDDRVVVTFSPEGASAVIFNTDGRNRVYFNIHSNTDNSAATELRNSEDAVFDHPELLETDNSPLVMTDWPRRLVIPHDADISVDEAEKMAHDMFPGSADYEILTTRAEDADVVSLIPRGLEGFILRTFPESYPTDRLAIMLEYFRFKASPGENKLCVHIAGDSLDAAAFRGIGLQILTSLKAPTADDMMYFVAAIWENLDFSNATDSLILSGDVQECRRLASKFSRRLSDVHITPPSSDIPPHLTAQAILAAKTSEA